MVSRILDTLAPVLVGRAANPPVQPVGGASDFAFHALLYPNRSLSRGGFKQVMALIISVNLLNAVIYLTLGAWPVVIFCGIDILIVWLAFTLSYGQARRHERIILTDDALWVSRVLPSGHETRWRLNPAFVRVDIARPIAHESQLRLRQHGKSLTVASFLSPQERGELAAALTAALASRRLG